MLPNLRGHKWELCGVRRIFQIKNAKPHGRTDDQVRRSGNAIEIRNALSTKGAREDLGWKNGRGRNLKIRGNGVEVDGGGRGWGGCGDKARTAQETRICRRCRTLTPIL